MERREFIKSVGIAGVFSLLASIPVNASSGEPRKDSGQIAFTGPFDLALEPSGNLLVSDPSGYRIVRVDSSLKPVDWFGQAGSQEGRLNFPKGLAVDSSGLIYVVDSNNCRVQVFDRGGIVKQVIGSIGSIGG
jgi:sugar lactone lactonase YvrE